MEKSSFISINVKASQICSPLLSLTLAPRCVQVSEERMLGASLLLCGMKQENSVGLSAQLLGNALLGVYLGFFTHFMWFTQCSFFMHFVSFVLLLLSNPGKVEMSKGIHALFKGMPLSWERGYLSRALAVMERVAAASGDVKLSKDSVRIEKMCKCF